MESGTGGQTPRQVVASYGSYEEAQRAVDHLSDEGFPGWWLSIVGQDLKIVEQVTGRRACGKAAPQGAVSGAVAGAFFGLLFGLLGATDPIVSGVALAVWGLAFGAVVLSHAGTGGRQDFSSVGGLRAARYDVMADEEVAEDAQGMLSGLRGNTVGPRGRAA